MPSEKILAAKKQVVADLVESFKGAATFVFASSRGLTVEQDTNLRNELRKNGVKFPRLLVAIDDISTVIESWPNAVNTMRDILLNGRAVGIHLIAVTQTPTWKETKSISTHTSADAYSQAGLNSVSSFPE